MNEEIIMMTRKEAGKLIHGFTAALTAETIAMVALIAKNRGAGCPQAAVEPFAVQYLAQYVVIEAAKHVYKYIPFIGNIANAATTIAITEALGWATYEVCVQQCS